MDILIKNNFDLILPKRSSGVAAGYDVIAASDPLIKGVRNQYYKGEGWTRIDYIEYSTNIKIAPKNQSFHVLLFPRSSISKYNLVLANSIGLVDNDYRGEIIFRFKYLPQAEDIKVRFEQVVYEINYDYIYKKGDKIGQLVIAPTIDINWNVVEELPPSQRGEGGFGSTGN